MQPSHRKSLLTLGVDSSSILFNHPSFQTPANRFPVPGFGRCSGKIRIPGKNGGGTIRITGESDSLLRVRVASSMPTSDTMKLHCQKCKKEARREDLEVTRYSPP